MYRTIKKYVDKGDWRSATKELIEILNKGEWNDLLAIYAATIAYETGDKELAFDYISQGLEYNYCNYELYFMLGRYYEQSNINQAWLCYENAEYYCTDVEDLEIIRQYKWNAENTKDWSVHKMSIVILTSYENGINTSCIDSIRTTNSPSSYELIVVNNESTDEENRGYLARCNQGIKCSNRENDILLLNNDTIVLPNAIFWLRMGLYDTEKVGATASVTNGCRNGEVASQADIENYTEWSKKLNVPKRNIYEKVVWLRGAALLIKRRVLDEIGILDENFVSESNGIMDFCARLKYAGWSIRLCHNSFIIYSGNGTGEKIEGKSGYTLDNFSQKWGFNLSYYSQARQGAIDLIEQDKDKKISVLEIGCGCGSTLFRIEYLWPNASVKGIEIVEDIARMGQHDVEIICGNAENIELPYEEKEFDYIILFDVLEHMYKPEEMLMRLMPYLKDDGRFLCSIPNIMYGQVICNLLRGKFIYEDAGILDRTHVRFFTLESIKQMLHNCGLSMEKSTPYYVEIASSDEDSKILEKLYQIEGVADKNLFQVYQYIFSAKKLIVD